MPNQGGTQGGTHEQHVKAGQQSHKNDGRKQQQQQAAPKTKDGGHRGGGGNFAEDRERVAEAGRKGGRH